MSGPTFDATGKIVHDSIEWDKAACLDADPDLFFTSGGKEAREVCATCPIIDDCATYAIDHRERYGVWGGMTERDLRTAITRSGTPLRECQECGEVFESKYASDFCGNECRQHAHSKSRKRSRNTKAIPTVAPLTGTKRRTT